MSRGWNPDFLDRFARLEERVRRLEAEPSTYMETVIVGGSFDSSTDVPPFFTPFGGAIVAVYGRVISGDADIRVLKNSVNIFGGATNMILSAGVTEIIEIDPPVYLDEGDLVQVDIVGAATPTGLSVGIIIHP